MDGYDSKRNPGGSKALVRSAGWVQSLAADRYPNPNSASDSTTFEIDIPLELSSVSRTGENARLLLSILHSAVNNFLPISQASKMLSLVFQNNSREIFHSLIAGRSPATQAIARAFLPAAINSLDCSLVRTLLDTGVNPDSYVDNRRRRPLQIAISKQSVEITQLLLSRGSDVNLHFVTAFPSDLKTPLEAAVQTGRLDLVQLIIRAGAYVNDSEPSKRASALCIASKVGHLQLVQLLLDAGADVNGPPRSDPPETALQAAAGARSIEVVQLLLSYGADVNPCYISHGRHWDPETALQFATSSGNVEITQLLLFHGAVDVVQALELAGQSQHGHVVNHLVHFWMTSHAFLGSEFGGTALRAATRCSDFELIRTLLDCGAPTDGDSRRQTALQIAAQQGDVRICELLISYGADINAPASGHRSAGIFSPACNHECPEIITTALLAAVRGNYMQLVQVLLSHHADVNASAGPGGNTALVAAAARGNFEIFRLLLDHGADMKDQGASVVAEAAEYASLDFLQYVLDTWTHHSGGNLDWTVKGCTVLERATHFPDIGIIRLLLQYESGDTSLAFRIAVCGHVDMEVVKLFLASGAEIGYLDDDGYEGYEDDTVLDSVTREGHLEILRLLLEHRTGLTGDEKSQAFQVAVYWGELDAARLLLANGADVNAAPLAFIDDTRRTALQIAANGTLEMVQFLLEAGADVEGNTSSGGERAFASPASALQFAAIAGSTGVVTALIQAGANVFAPAIGEDGRTALEGAAEHGRLDIVQLLLNLGVEVTGSRAIQFAREEGHDGVVALLEDA
jgi:ankyrin repeat protein